MEFYRPPSELELPADVVNKYRAEGMTLRWLRAELSGGDDSRNIGKRLREGYQLVQKSELPEEYRDFFDTKKIRTNNQVVCVGDLVLAKIPTERAKARQRYYEKASSDAVAAAIGEITESDDARMAALPVINESSTEVQFVPRGQKREG